jgi:hypothetical protein
LPLDSELLKTITESNAGGPRRVPIRAPLAARASQFGRWTASPSMSDEPKESYTEYYNRKRPFQWFKAAFGCFGVHVALTTILALIVLSFGATDSLPFVLLGYMCFGWIPLAIWLYPFFLRRMK